mmetsp:Transcript_9877/g.28435  ORF Transcript_9877/g.28435 Transcript_9877/m.28435 type:complete len:93 (-) Transcript_9877:167-445(-)
MAPAGAALMVMHIALLAIESEIRESALTSLRAFPEGPNEVNAAVWHSGADEAIASPATGPLYAASEIFCTEAEYHESALTKEKEHCAASSAV